MSKKDFLGPFRLIRLIRAGTMTQVWEAVREGEKDRCALKVLKLEQVKNKSEIEALKHETKVAKDLAHPNVIKIYDYFSDYGQPLVQMEYYPAKNLKLMIRDHYEDVAKDVGAIIKKCAAGLDHMHQRGWIHCDIKPDNFLADGKGGVKVIDFSIAKPVKQGFKLFGSKKIQGTKSYMAPEQIRGKKLDVRTDVYGLGCVMFELVAKRPPFTGSNPEALLKKHLNSAPPPLESFERRVRMEFAGLVARMLAKEPDKRPASMQEVLQEFSKMRVFRAGGQSL